MGHDSITKQKWQILGQDVKKKFHHKSKDKNDLSLAKMSKLFKP
jgi:hypothetical protein